MMPRTSVFIIRASMVALVAGGMLGLVAIPSPITIPARVHADAMLLGFMLPFAFGTAAWILPKRGKVRAVTIPAIIYFGGLLTLSTSYVIPLPSIEITGRSVLAVGTILFAAALLPRVRHITAVRRHDHSTSPN
jgi:hypothetical protein